MKVLYTGSFDPITLGHLDIINRVSSKFDEVVVTVFNNQSKNYWFNINERCEMVKEAVAHLQNVKVDYTEGLVVDYCKKNNIKVIIRGLRAVSDYEYELSITGINKHLDNELETLFLVASPEFSFLSSSMVKEVASYGGAFQSLVPKNVSKRIITKLGRQE